MQGVTLLGIWAWDKAVAAYNCGLANLDKDIAAHGTDWLQYAPKETRGEVANVVGGAIAAEVRRVLAEHVKEKEPAPDNAAPPSHARQRRPRSSNIRPRTEGLAPATQRETDDARVDHELDPGARRRLDERRSGGVTCRPRSRGSDRRNRNDPRRHRTGRA